MLYHYMSYVMKKSAFYRAMAGALAAAGGLGGVHYCYSL